MRAEELVRRAGEVVRPERGHVDGHVGGVVDAVDVELAPGRVDQLGDRRDVGSGADQVGRGGDRHQPGAVGEDRRHLLHVELAGLGVEVRPAHGRPRPLGRDRPGADVGIVVEPAHHDLVVRPPALGECPCQVHRQLGHRPAEHDPVRGDLQEVGDGGPPLGQGEGCVALGRRHGVVVGQGRGQRVVDGLGDDVRGLHAARTVEVRGTETLPLAQLREVGAHARDVVRRAGRGRRDGVGHRPIVLRWPNSRSGGGCGGSVVADQRPRWGDRREMSREMTVQVGSVG